MFFIQLLRQTVYSSQVSILKLQNLQIASNISINSTNSDVFYVEKSSNDPSLPKPNTPIFLNSTEMSGNDTREMISISSIASPGPHFGTIDSDLNEPTMPYGFERQLLFIPPSLNDLNLPPNRFNILATVAVVNPTEDGRDKNYSPQSPELSEPSLILTPPMNLSTVDGWETPHTTTDDNTFYSSDEPKRIYFLPSSPSSLPSPPRKMKRKLEMGMSFLKRSGVSRHVCDACRQVIPLTKDIPGPSTMD